MSGPTFEHTDTHQANWTDVPEALRSLWNLCMQNQSGSDVARALTCNFIGITEAANAQELFDATTLLQRRMPCRAFLLLLDDDAADSPAELRATTRCHGKVRDIVLEQIVIRLPRNKLGDMPGLIRPLLMDDLPSHLFWALPWPADENEFDTLSSLCGHAMVDSRGFGNPARELMAIAQRRDAGQNLSDLSWLRVQPWRRALAEAFERLDWQAGTTVTGTVQHGKLARASSFLLSEWLHERLAAQIALEPDGSADGIGPDHVNLKVGDVEIIVDRNDAELVTHVTTQQTCYLPFKINAHRGSDADLLTAAMNAG